MYFYGRSRNYGNRLRVYGSSMSDEFLKEHKVWENLGCTKDYFLMVLARLRLNKEKVNKLAYYTMTLSKGEPWSDEIIRMADNMTNF